MQGRPVWNGFFGLVYNQNMGRGPVRWMSSLLSFSSFSFGGVGLMQPCLSMCVCACVVFWRNFACYSYTFWIPCFFSLLSSFSFYYPLLSVPSFLFLHFLAWSVRENFRSCSAVRGERAGNFYYGQFTFLLFCLLFILEIFSPLRGGTNQL